MRAGAIDGNGRNLARSCREAPQLPFELEVPQLYFNRGVDESAVGVRDERSVRAEAYNTAPRAHGLLDRGAPASEFPHQKVALSIRRGDVLAVSRDGQRNGEQVVIFDATTGRPVREVPFRNQTCGRSSEERAPAGTGNQHRIVNPVIGCSARDFGARGYVPQHQAAVCVQGSESCSIGVQQHSAFGDIPRFDAPQQRPRCDVPDADVRHSGCLCGLGDLGEIAARLLNRRCAEAAISAESADVGRQVNVASSAPQWKDCLIQR